MSLHGAQAVPVPVATIDDVKVYLRERAYRITKLDKKLHGSVLPRDLVTVRELHYRFVNSTVVGECKTWLYVAYRRTALILDYWCDIPNLYEKLLKFVLDDLKMHYNVEIVYLHAVRTDEVERRLLGEALRDLGFTMVDDEYAVLVM